MATKSPPTRRALLLAAAGLLAVAAWFAPAWLPRGTRGPATYIGRESCAECHPLEARTFVGSHHDLAMATPTADTVVGDFQGAQFPHFGVTSTFRRQGERYIANTDGPDNTLRDHPIAYVFGFTPLQQYLVDVGEGRLQSLTIAWDCRAREQGGQRWFSLYPDEPTPPGDELHWTGIQQNWNFMCAECHSTNLRKGYDAANDSYRTTWSEIDVSCEACHGPASWHLGWARGERAFADLGEVPGKGLVVAFDERRGAIWTNDPATGLPKRSIPRTSQKELDTCARCHSRRTVFDEDFVPGRPLLDTHWPSHLTEGLYHADGQMQGEVYNYQSFLQSRMAMAGVTCSDCHEPHSGKPRGVGNSLCLQCHDPRFDRKEHHFHQPGTPAALCTACHAPTVTYMGVDARHDHSFGLPRPDLTEQSGTPNACNGCHDKESAAWATAKVKQWYGRLRPDRAPWTGAFAAARAHRPEARELLLLLAGDGKQPGIVRATALHELPEPFDRASVVALVGAFEDPDPLLRWTAATALAESAPGLQGGLRALLRDPVRAVRMAAARGLAVAPTTGWPEGDVAARDAGVAEYVDAQQLNADRPEARMNLGNLRRDQGRPADAEAEFRAALRLHPQFVAAYVNLADLHREAGREVDCERALREGLARVPGSADLMHALGLCLVRQQRLDDAIQQLGGAVRAAPEQARFAYVHAVALESMGRMEQAIAALDAAIARLPEDSDLRELQVEYLAKHGDLPRARSAALEHMRRWPDSDAAARWRSGLLR